MHVRALPSFPRRFRFRFRFWCRLAAALAFPVCFRGKLTVFTVLCEQYQPSLRRDPMYNEVRAGGTLARGWRAGQASRGRAHGRLCPQYLDRIGQLFFGVPPKQTSSYGGLLGEAAPPARPVPAGPRREAGLPLWCLLWRNTT